MNSTNFYFVVSCSMRGTVEKHCHRLQTTIKSNAILNQNWQSSWNDVPCSGVLMATYLVDLTKVDAITHKTDQRENGVGSKRESYQLKSREWNHGKIMNALRRQSLWIWGQSFILKVPDKEKCMRKWTAAKKIFFTLCHAGTHVLQEVSTSLWAIEALCCSLLVKVTDCQSIWCKCLHFKVLYTLSLSPRKVEVLPYSELGFVTEFQNTCFFFLSFFSPAKTIFDIVEGQLICYLTKRSMFHWKVFVGYSLLMTLLGSNCLNIFITKTIKNMSKENSTHATMYS